MARMIITQCFISYDINAYDQSGYTPLILTARGGYFKLCRLLCERSDVDVDVEKGYEHNATTLLHTAARNAWVKYFGILLDVGKANVHPKDNGSFTHLHWAAVEGLIEAATLLIERGVEINPLNDNNATPLDYAHVFSDTAMIALPKTKRAVSSPQPVVEEGSGEESNGDY